MHTMQIMNETESIWEYKVGISAIIAIFVCLWKGRLGKMTECFVSSGHK